MPGWEVRFVGKESGEIRTEDGALGLVADRALDEIADAGHRPRPRRRGQPAADPRRARCSTGCATSTRPTKWTTSVCTGSLVLGAAGLLEGKRATAHWLYLEALREFGAEPIGGRWVEDGKIITAAGVSAGIDMALHLVAQEVGPEVAQAVQLGIEYDPDPPFDAGSPAKAPPAIVEIVRRRPRPPATRWSGRPTSSGCRRRPGPSGRQRPRGRPDAHGPTSSGSDRRDRPPAPRSRRVERAEPARSTSRRDRLRELRA